MFPKNAPSAPTVFFRSYAHNKDGRRETWKEVCDRTIGGLTKLGKLTQEETDLLYEQQLNFKCLSSGRWLWVGGREWIENPQNFPGAYNCTSLRVNSLETFGLLMDLAMMGCGTGAVLTEDCISQLPVVGNYITIQEVTAIGTCPIEERRQETKVELDPTIESNQITIRVGDSRKGWVDAYQALINLSFDSNFDAAAYSDKEAASRYANKIDVIVELSSVRPAGEKLKGFGGVSNPIKLPELFSRCAEILNGAIGRKLNSIECCLLIDEAAATIVAGGIRRTAGMRQFIHTDKIGSTAKDNLYVQNENGKWITDPKRDVLRMSNHTRIFDRAPTLDECIESVGKQYLSGEGAIQWEGETVVRANCDRISGKYKTLFLDACKIGKKEAWMQKNLPYLHGEIQEHRINRNGLNPCVTADTWVHTEFGARQVKDLIGIQHGTYVNGELFSTTVDGFFYTGNKPVFTLTTKEGMVLRLTGNHKVLRVTSQTQKHQYTEWVATENLKMGDRICLHNHRDIQPWQGVGTYEEGWLLGNLIGDGSLAKTPWNDVGILRFWGKTQAEMIEYAVATLQKNVFCGVNLGGHYHKQHNMYQVTSSGLAKLAAEFGVYQGRKAVTAKIEESSHVFYCGFLRGLFDADGSVQGTQSKGICVRLAQSNLETLKSVQRMLMRLGIVSTVYKDRRIATYRLLPDTNRNPKTYLCKADHELVIANDNLVVFRDVIGFRQPDKQQKLDGLLADYRRKLNRERFITTVESINLDRYEPVFDCTVPGPSQFDANGIVAHNCGEIIGADFLCNLSEIHLNTINPQSLSEQEQAFKAGAITVAVFLHHKFEHPLLQKSREFDPIVGVSFTGLFDFFVNAFGVKWLQWFAADRPQFYEVPIVEENIQAICEMLNINIDEYETVMETGWNFGTLYRDIEKAYLSHWRQIVEKEVRNYCDRHGLKCPSRYTTCQPSGCTTKDAVRIFDQGLLFADEHMEIGSGACNLESDNLTVRGGIPVLSGIANEELSLIRITLENGRQLTMTPNHRLSIDGVWIYAENMKLGQNLDIEIGNYNNAEDAILDYVDIEQTVKKGGKQISCNLPGRMSPELGYFIGCLFGNGCVSEYKYRIRFSHGNIEILEKIANLGTFLFGIKGCFTKDSRGGRTDLTFSNKQLYQWFVTNNIHKAVKSNVLDKIPQKLRMSSQKSLLAFFAGLIDTDGCIRKEGHLSIDSASESFLRHLQQIGEAVGLSFSLFTNTEGENKQETKLMFGLCLSRMKSTLDALSFINQYSIKARYRPLLAPKRVFSFSPYKIAKIETDIKDYTYDYAVEGEDDDDSWYWQGAIKSHNTKSLLTGASPGWHPPKAQWFIRRITIAKENPIALAAIDCGYSVIPAPGDKDASGQLLDDPFDERCTEWLIEIPTAVNWADLPGVEEIDISQFSASAQFDYYMQVQRHYTTHNTSATIEVREHEVDALGKDIYDAIQEDKGYVSAAILARFDDHETYPRLPFEPISKETYLKLCQEVEARRTCDDFYIAISRYSSPEEVEGPAACDSDKCLFPQSPSEKQ
jgi:ribonucleotide reductase, class II